MSALLTLAPLATIFIGYSESPSLSRLPDRRLTSQRTIIIVHGNGTNRASPGEGLLNLSADLAHHGFAVLGFDLRDAGSSPASARSFGVYEQRDVLGAVDFLRSGAEVAAGHPGARPSPRYVHSWWLGGLAGDLRGRQGRVAGPLARPDSIRAPSLCGGGNSTARRTRAQPVDGRGVLCPAAGCGARRVYWFAVGM